MKKILFFASLAAAATMTLGCSKDNIEGNDNVPGNGEVSYFEPQTIIKASSSATKTALSGLEILWEEGDVISLFNENGTPMNYSLTDGAGSTSGTFAADGEPTTGYSYAIYPVVSGQVSGTSVPVTVASAQTYLAGGFSAEYPMAATTGDGMNFTFENLATVLSLSLQGDAVVRSVTVEAVGGEGLSGAATVDFSGEIPSLSATEGASASVTLNCGESGVALSADAATEFTFVVIPGVYEQGFRVTVTETNGNVTTRTASSSISLNAGSIAKLNATLPIDTPQGWNLVGDFNGWGTTWVELENAHGLFYTPESVVIEEGNTEFKIRYGANEWYGYSNVGTVTEVTPQKAFTVYRTGGEPGGEQWPGKDEGNLTVKEGTYDFYFDQNPHNVIIMPAGIAPFGIVGSITSWGDDADIPLLAEGEWLVAKNVVFEETGAFKIRFASSWNGADGNGYNLGFAEEDKSVVINDEANIVVNSTNDAPNNNMNIAAGTYDIYFDLGGMKVWVMTPGNTPSQN